MPSWYEVLLLALAGWRVGHLLTMERGPYSILARIRERLGVEHNADGEPTSWPLTEIGDLMKCSYCWGFWLAFLLTGLFLIWPWVIWLTIPLTISALIILIGRASDG